MASSFLMSSGTPTLFPQLLPSSGELSTERFSGQTKFDTAAVFPHARIYGTETLPSFGIETVANAVENLCQAKERGGEKHSAVKRLEE